MKDNADIMTHNNQNLMCVIDTETTGLDPRKHDIIQICVMPIDTNFRPLKKLYGKNILPFAIWMKPRFPENVQKQALSVNGIDLDWLMANGIDHYRAQTMFDQWFDLLELGYNKKITPLGHNYQFDKGFITEWLGPTAYDNAFHCHYRDSMVTALAMNDAAFHRKEPVPFSKVALSYLANKLSVPADRGHDAVQDCLVTTEVYRKMIQASMHVTPEVRPENLAPEEIKTLTNGDV